jgi:hypothetical protein
LPRSPSTRKPVDRPVLTRALTRVSRFSGPLV